MSPVSFSRGLRKKGTVTVAIVAAEKQAATRLAERAAQIAGNLFIWVGSHFPEQADAIICLLDYGEIANADSPVPEWLINGIIQRSAAWGKQLTPAQRPVFLVIYNWEKQVPTGKLAETLDWLEEKKREFFDRLSRALAERRVSLESGFGSVSCRVWAISLSDTQSPKTALANFGVVQLLEQACRAAQEFHRRVARQKRAIATVTLICLAVPIVLALSLWRLGARLETVPAGEAISDDPTRYLPPLERLAWWVDRGRRLLSWEDWRHGGAVLIDWPGWMAEVGRFHQAVTKLPRPDTPQALLWDRALNEISYQLTRVEQRAAALGAVDGTDASSQANPSSAPLAFLPLLRSDHSDTRDAFDAFLAQIRQRASQMQKDFPIAWADRKPLPGELPLEVADNLRQLAELRYRAVLEPVQVEIARQLRRLGNGKETVSAWRELVQQGWLGGSARRELSDWLSVVQLLRSWSGLGQGDPLDALVQFVLQESIPLPLGRIFLVWPGKVSPSLPLPSQSAFTTPLPVFTQPPTELRIYLLGPGHAETVLVYQRVPTTSVSGSKEAESSQPVDIQPRQESDLSWQRERYEYRLVTPVPWPGEVYSYRPGVIVRVQGRIQDTSGRTRHLTWSEREARSQVYGFTTLELTPRLHAPNQLPESGECLPGLRLELSVPLPIPDLLP